MTWRQLLVGGVDDVQDKVAMNQVRGGSFYLSYLTNLECAGEMRWWLLERSSCCVWSLEMWRNRWEGWGMDDLPHLVYKIL